MEVGIGIESNLVILSVVVTIWMSLTVSLNVMHWSMNLGE